MTTLFSEKVLISNRCIGGLMPNLIKKSWTDSITGISDLLTRAIAGYGALWLADAALPYIVGGVIFLLWLGFTAEMFIL